MSRECPWRKLLYKSEPESCTNAIAERGLEKGFKVAKFQGFRVSKKSAPSSSETLKL
jgi:hypothetical protein